MNRSIRLTATPPLPADVPGALAAIVGALGLPPNADPATVRAAFDALLVAGDPAHPSHGLTDSEVRAVRATRGATAVSFLAARKFRGGR